MTYITVYNLSFNSNCRILSAELNCIFTLYFYKIWEKFIEKWRTSRKMKIFKKWEIAVTYYISKKKKKNFTQTKVSEKLNFTSDKKYPVFSYTEKCPLWIWKRYIPLLIDLLISNNFSSMTYFCAMRILWVIGRQSIRL